MSSRPNLELKQEHGGAFLAQPQPPMHQSDQSQARFTPAPPTWQQPTTETQQQPFRQPTYPLMGPSEGQVTLGSHAQWQMPHQQPSQRQQQWGYHQQSMQTPAGGAAHYTHGQLDQQRDCYPPAQDLRTNTAPTHVQAPLHDQWQAQNWEQANSGYHHTQPFLGQGYQQQQHQSQNQTWQHSHGSQPSSIGQQRQRNPNRLTSTGENQVLDCSNEQARSSKVKPTSWGQELSAEQESQRNLPVAESSPSTSQQKQTFRLELADKDLGAESWEELVDPTFTSMRLPKIHQAPCREELDDLVVPKLAESYPKWTNILPSKEACIVIPKDLPHPIKLVFSIDRIANLFMRHRWETRFLVPHGASRWVSKNMPVVRLQLHQLLTPAQRFGVAEGQPIPASNRKRPQEALDNSQTSPPSHTETPKHTRV